MQRPDWTALRTASARIDGSLFFSRAQLAWLAMSMVAGVATVIAEQSYMDNFAQGSSIWPFMALRWLMLLMEIPVIVNVHRRLLLNEQPAIRVSGLELRYALITIVIFFLRSIPARALPVFFSIFGIHYARLAYTIAQALLLVLIIPLTLLLPATATSRRQFRFRQAAEAARTHLIYIIGYFFVLALFLGLNGIQDLLARVSVFAVASGHAAPQLLEIGRGALTGLIFFLYATIGGTILSLVYAAITSPRPRPTLTASRDAGEMVLR